jgi:hypothetical protein
MVCGRCMLDVLVSVCEVAMKALVLLAMSSCVVAPTSYMLPVVEVHCPLPLSKSDCAEAITDMCHGSSFIVVMSRRADNGEVFYVSCERAQ